VCSDSSLKLEYTGEQEKSVFERDSGFKFIELRKYFRADQCKGCTDVKYRLLDSANNAFVHSSLTMMANGTLKVDSASPLIFEGSVEAYFDASSSCQYMLPVRKQVSVKVCGFETVVEVSKTEFKDKFEIGRDPQSILHSTAQLFQVNDTECPISQKIT
jgi:hypothetical protein